MPKIPKKGLVNRTAVGTYQGKLHQRSSGSYGAGKPVKGKRTAAEPEKRRPLATTKRTNNIQCDGRVVDISTLIPDPLNARLHPERNLSAIMESLETYGQRKPVVVNERTMIVVAGNGTLEAAKALGWTKIAASIRPMTDEEAMGYGLADNRTAELAKWDFEVVARLDKLMSEAGQSKMVGWSSDELEVLRAADWTPPSQTDDEYDHQDNKLVVVFTEKQYEIVKDAIEKLRELSDDCLEGFTEAECLEAICSNWLEEIS